MTLSGVPSILSEFLDARLRGIKWLRYHEPKQSISMAGFKPKAIIFDLLTALLDSWTIWDAAIPEEERSITAGQAWRKHYLEITYACDAYKPYEDLVRQSAKDVGLSLTATKALLERMDEILPWPEVPGTLAELKAQGYKLAVVTNCSNELGYRAISNCEKAVREKTSMKNFSFDHTVTAEESGFYKPNSKPYRDALEKLGVEAPDALFVAGSSLDVPGASNVGMTVALHNHVGLPRWNERVPWREGKTLGEALGDMLQ